MQSTCESVPICVEPVSEHQRSDQRRKKTIGYHSCGRKTVYLSSFLGNAHLQTLSNHTQTPTCIAHNATCPTNTYKNGNRVCISFGTGQWIHSMLCLVIPQNLVSCCRDDDDVVGDAALPDIRTNSKMQMHLILVETPLCASVQHLSVNTKDQTSGERRQLGIIHVAVRRCICRHFLATRTSKHSAITHRHQHALHTMLLAPPTHTKMETACAYPLA